MERIFPKIVKDIEKTRFWSRSQDFCQFLEGFGIGFGEFGLGKKRIGFRFGEFGLRKKYWFRFRKIWSWEKSIGFGFGKFGIGKKVSVSVSVKILVTSFSVVRIMLYKSIAKGKTDPRVEFC